MMRLSVFSPVLTVATTLVLGLVATNPASALSCSDLQRLLDAKEASLQMGINMPHDGTKMAALCRNARQTFEIKKKIIKYNSFAKQCGQDMAYKQHQDIGPDLMQIDRNFLGTICEDHRP